MRNYAEMIVKEINEKHENLSAEIVDITKMNDEKLVGVMIKKGDSMGGSVHYVREYHVENMSVEECAAHFVSNMRDESEVPLADKEEITWDDVKDNITMRLINTEYNEEYLKDKVRKDLGNGFTIMFDVTTDVANIAVTKSFADSLGCDDLTLTLAAQYSRAGEPVLRDMAEALFANEPTNLLEGEKTSRSGMFVLTTANEHFGASAIYRGGVGDRIKEVVGDYYLLPSSVHEWIVVPKDSGIEVRALKKMVEDANASVVERCDLLAYGVYEWTARGVKKVA